MAVGLIGADVKFHFIVFSWLAVEEEVPPFMFVMNFFVDQLYCTLSLISQQMVKCV
jgi:hypothetical protein